MRSHLLGVAVALAPFAVLAPGIPSAVVTDVVRSSGSAVVDGIRLNQELIAKEERGKAAAAPAATQAPQPRQSLPQPQMTPAPR